MAAPMRSMQNRSWTRSCAARAIMSASGWSVSRRTMAAASAGGSWGGTSRPVTPSVIISGMPPTLRRDDRPRQRHRLQDHQSLRLAVGGQHGHVQRGGDRGHVLAAAREHDLRVGAGVAGADATPPPRQDRPAGPARLPGPPAPPGRTPPPRPAAGRQGPARGRAAMPSMSVVWPFSGSSRPTTPTIGAPAGKPYSSGSVQHASWWS